MASIWSTASAFVQTTFTHATATVDSLGTGIEAFNKVVENNSKRVIKTSLESNKIEVARFNQTIADELAANVNLKLQYDKVSAEW
jgi:hypothetical protein